MDQGRQVILMVDVKIKKKEGGLAGVIAGDSAICLCDPHEETLLYRGYPIDELAKHCSFDEVAWLLLHHDMPTPTELEGFLGDLKQLRALSPSIKAFLESMPPTFDLMDVLRSAVSLLGHLHPEKEESDPFFIGERVFASLGPMLLYWYQFHASGKRITLETEETSFAAHLLHLFYSHAPTQEQVKAFNTSLILYAEHEFNASTFTVRTIASTRSDYYSAICGGIGALKGPLHGGANEAALQLIKLFKTPEEAEKGILEKLDRGELIMGFGHRVYTTHDPRSDLIKKEAKLLAKSEEQKKLFKIGEKIEEVMRREKHLFPNLDFYSALCYDFLNLPVTFFTPLFVISRITGWTAHFYEQKAHNKLIRPSCHYIGPSLRHLSVHHPYG